MPVHTLVCRRRAVSVAAANGPPLDPLWLRLSDPSQQTHNGQRLFEISDVMRNKSCVEVKSSAASDEGLRVEWGDGAESFYPTAWLESQQQQASVPAPQQHLWGAGFQEFVPRIQHEELSSGAGQLKVASSLERYGIALLQGVPAHVSVAWVRNGKLRVDDPTPPTAPGTSRRSRDKRARSADGVPPPARASKRLMESAAGVKIESTQQQAECGRDRVHHIRGTHTTRNFVPSWHSRPGHVHA